MNNLVEDLFIKCEETGNYYLKSKYPLTCKCCQRLYKTRQEYLDMTFPLKKGDYTVGPKDGTILEYRNCQCGTTITCLLQDRRDVSTQGVRIREEFENQLNFLTNNGLEKDKARMLLLSKKDKKKKAA